MRQFDLFIPPKRSWNAGRLIGPKAPLKPKHIWAIRQQLKVTKRVRDLALFNSLWIPNFEPATWSGCESATWCQTTHPVRVSPLEHERSERLERRA